VVALLLANKADVNVTNENGRTPLHYAATQNHTDLVELLLANQADVNAKDIEGKTPLSLALRNKRNTAVAELLRQHGGQE